MAGHSKWANIKHRKARQDAKRGKIFTRVIKEVTIASRMGGGDPDGNPRLRAAIAEAKSHNVPMDNIDRAIKRGTGEMEGVNYEELTYEGYGPGGVAILVEAMTDNKNRTVGELRHLLSKHGGNMGENGCVSWMFDRKGHFAIEGTQIDEETFMELALELEAEDFESDQDAYTIYSAPEDYQRIRDALEEREDLEVAVKEVAMIPQNLIKVEGGDARKVIILMEALEDHDDIQNVWANFDIDEEILAEMGAE
jgi:YebC/PmpR family DNA-binding regulatory protein